jgi:hypothetical protein
MKRARCALSEAANFNAVRQTFSGNVPIPIGRIGIKLCSNNSAQLLEQTAANTAFFGGNRFFARQGAPWFLRFSLAGALHISLAATTFLRGQARH